MWSAASSGALRSCLIASVVVVCFGAASFMCYYPAVRWLPCPAAPDPPHKLGRCPTVCSDVPKMENGTQASVTDTAAPPEARKRESGVRERNTVLLIWAWPFGMRFELSACDSVFGVKGCRLTLDRDLYSRADGVLFHHQGISGDLSNMPKVARPARQKWVWLNVESPANSARIPALDNLFNLTVSYRRDADVAVPYGHLAEAASEEAAFEIPRKDKLVCWVVSNWNPNFSRVKYFTELSTHVKIEVYGQHFGKAISSEDYSKIMSSCKFYLSFENSASKDYITEKLFKPLMLGSVPVALGTTRQNYEEYVPGGAFIHVDDFPSPKELAERLAFLDKNEEAYKQYFNWRKTFVSKGCWFGPEHACRACEHIRRHKSYKVFNNLIQWYWG